MGGYLHLGEPAGVFLVRRVGFDVEQLLAEDRQLLVAVLKVRLDAIDLLLCSPGARRGEIEGKGQNNGLD